ncbi:CCA tRNA nucleotidyltransferase [Candidatus Micrarchaeota archaeon]|nr:CCA tRNA nucleotidyltransferase [Candidatus Micrarchaeota archaeon]
MQPGKKLEAIAQKVARRASPTPQEAEKERAFAERFIAKLAPKLKDAKLMLVGSTARDTGLVGDKDVDVFAAFPRDMEEDDIVKKTVSAVKTVKANWVMHYAEHPYLQAVVEGYQVEVIPCFAIGKNQPLKSAVDRTPLHMDFLQKKLTASQRQDVRALKQLLKTHGLYGAEQAVKGFSGILCEYLVLNYRSFSGVIEAVKDWKPPVQIDFVRTYKTFEAPLVFIDAVDENRNVAAVVSETQLNRFIALSQTLWSRPTQSLFYPAKTQDASASSLQKTLDQRKTDWAVLQFQKPDVVEDIFWPQLERTAAALKKQFALRQFTVFSDAVFDDARHAYLFLELEHATLPHVRRALGPPVSQPAHVDRFIKGKKPWRGPFVQQDRVVVEEPRNDANAWAFLRKVQKNPGRFGVASYLQKPFKKSSVLHAVNALPKAAQEALAAHVHRKEPWW